MIISTYKKKLFLYSLLLFSLFSVVMLAFQYHREETLKAHKFEQTLDLYCELVNLQFPSKGDTKSLEKLIATFEEQTRITVILFDGTVVFDNKSDDLENISNHANRPEIINAKRSGHGVAKRYSNTIKKDYYYYAKRFDQGFVRASLPYAVAFSDLIKPDNFLFYFIGFVFVISCLLLLFFSNKFGKYITQLRDFSYASSPEMAEEIDFPKGELGDIGRRIKELYQNLNEANLSVLEEKNKLIRHLQNSQEGIAIYDSQGKNIYANARFIQYASMLSSKHSFNMDAIINERYFSNIKLFISDAHQSGNQPDKPNTFEETVCFDSYYIAIKAVLFEDLSYEIILNDITKQEENKTVKRELTQSIAHELKTPISAIRGFIETLLNVNVSEEKKIHFLKRALRQSERLSELIDDIATITKLEDGNKLYHIGEHNLSEIIRECCMDMEHAVQEKELELDIQNLPENLPITGSNSLLKSIFQNLISNAVKYLPKGCKVTIDNYLIDENYAYFSVSDNGQGIPKEHLNRIFERFYRIEDGRDRESGGSGLGLSIVKHAILFHHGEIKAKNKDEGGLEFIFTLKLKP